MKSQDFHNLKQGKPIALERLYKSYHRMLFWLGKQLIRDDFVIENLVQDCFLKLWQQRDTIESPRHIFFFLRLVMKRECISYYTRPRNKFYRSINSLEYYENYNDYLLKDDAGNEQEHLKEQEEAQKALEKVERILPLLATKQQRLLELCLKFGFEYKAIARVMGSSTSAIYHEVQHAIEATKKIIYQGTATAKPKPIIFEGGLTETQAKVFELRCEQQLSFTEIAKTLGQSQKEVHQNFSLAYQYLQQQHNQQVETA